MLAATREQGEEEFLGASIKQFRPLNSNNSVNISLDVPWKMLNMFICNETIMYKVFIIFKNSLYEWMDECPEMRTVFGLWTGGPL